PAPADRADAVLEGVFRGQPVRDTTPINIYRAPDTVAYYTPPAREAKVEVRSEAHMGHLAILLDCSGSMGPRDPKNPRRYDQALAVLRAVLRRLRPGTPLSARALGHATHSAPD